MSEYQEIVMRNMKPKIESPCVKQCALENGSCLSCMRTITEIVSWKDMDPEERAEIMLQLPERRLVGPEPELDFGP